MKAVEPPPKGAEERPSLVEKAVPSPYSIIHIFPVFASSNFFKEIPPRTVWPGAVCEVIFR